MHPIPGIISILRVICTLWHLQVHSFDMFSLGVLALHLTIGRTEARDGLESVKVTC